MCNKGVDKLTAGARKKAAATATQQDNSNNNHSNSSNNNKAASNGGSGYTTTKTKPADDTNKINPSTSLIIDRPWYRKGGMTCNKGGIAMNIVVPVTVLCNELLTSEQKQQFVALLLVCYASAWMTGRKTIYCFIAVPTFFVSLVLSLALPSLSSSSSSSSSFLEEAGEPNNNNDNFITTAMFAVTLSIAIAIVKVNICMSVCLHRYAAHAAFKCGPYTQLALCLLGCLANQGGPIWWASQHRLHHKHCDGPRDPHSPSIDGTERAFGFFKVHNNIVEEFIPYHLVGGSHHDASLKQQQKNKIQDDSSRIIWYLDTWAWSVVSLEMVLAYTYFGGPIGLFVAFTSGWICQTITLWFNVANHPLKPKGSSSSNVDTSTKKNSSTSIIKKLCKATNDNEVDPWNDPAGFYLPFFILNSLVPLFASFVMELEHEHHHDHPMLAKRSKYDIAYWGFLYPLEKLGLVWNVIVKD